MQVSAKLNNYRRSPRKVRLVARRASSGLDVGEAENQLNFLIKGSAPDFEKLLKSAVSNAENNFGLDKDNLYIKEIIVDEGTNSRDGCRGPMEGPAYTQKSERYQNYFSRKSRRKRAQESPKTGNKRSKSGRNQGKRKKRREKKEKEEKKEAEKKEKKRISQTRRKRRRRQRIFEKEYFGEKYVNYCQKIWDKKSIRGVFE